MHKRQFFHLGIIESDRLTRLDVWLIAGWDALECDVFKFFFVDKAIYTSDHRAIGMFRPPRGDTFPEVLFEIYIIPPPISLLTRLAYGVVGHFAWLIAEDSSHV